MGNPKSPIPVKLFVGMLSPDVGLFDTCTQLLCAEHGPIDYQSEIVRWDFTDYYREEMGSGILRKFIFFKRLIDPGMLPSVKHLTNSIEARFSLTSGKAVRRRINLDPGYVTEAKVVLASTKDFSHRVYQGQGIYAEVTLHYSTREKSFLSFEHTYPDFRKKESLDLFNKAREMLRATLCCKGR
ncbi:MAG TPA: DUF4416 family protein [Nitrospirota bacterium]|nr:DUF4416 family protein [Nitrospirota bacterium]